MFKINLIEILVFTLLILFQLAYCNNNIEAPENESELSEMLHKTNQHKLTLQDLVELLDNSNNDEQYVNKRGGVWFGPRLGKRSKRSVESEFSRNELASDEGYEVPIDKLTFDSYQNSPYIIYLLTEKQPTRNNRNRYLTPRLGRDAVEMLEIQRARPPFAPRLGKKAIQFSPRLGRQLFEIPEQK